MGTISGSHLHVMRSEGACIHPCLKHCSSMGHLKLLLYSFKSSISMFTLLCFDSAPRMETPASPRSRHPFGPLFFGFWLLPFRPSPSFILAHSSVHSFKLCIQDHDCAMQSQNCTWTYSCTHALTHPLFYSSMFPVKHPWFYSLVYPFKHPWFYSSM
jgi:hypothetical protein